jgi:hypothetical protein
MLLPQRMQAAVSIMEAAALRSSARSLVGGIACDKSDVEMIGAQRPENI